MDIRQIMDLQGSKGATAALNGAAQDLQLLQPTSQANNFMGYPSPTNLLPLLQQPFHNSILQQEKDGGAGCQSYVDRTAEKPFLCNQCSKGFTTKGSLTRHSMICLTVYPHSIY